ncbi:uncharacterized protein TM35_000242470 [Trypanosoma theileri]|uniref:RNA-editing substrate-binding complex 7 protein domain-containing protein n=1 Tax=Trypanosoma theileri TaxID=67003 RepID=A0A1X0NQX9_9TRYP|nr:uncharacterized protein TM35_000242470 [Trypanosoma theileri]ORC87097.1 hypothetical protein TM35_000242470 [Trypanosoma theileri]
MKGSRQVLANIRPGINWSLRSQQQQQQQQRVILPIRVYIAAAMCVSAARSLHTPLQQQMRTLHLSAIVRSTAETPLTPTSENNNNNSENNNNNNKNNSVTALDIAIRVNKLKRLHQTGGGPSGKKRIELDAWNDLNSLTDEQINAAEGKAVSLLLNSWAYFAKYWEQGKNGPAEASTASAGEVSSHSEEAQRDSEKAKE